MSTKPIVLIIGGSSFIARNFIALLKDQYTVKTVSRKSTNHTNEEVITDFFNIPEEHFRQAYIVVNCAAIVHQQKEPPAEVFNKVNHELALSIAQKAKNAGVSTFIQLSTIAVYGNVKHITDTTPENPVNAYGKSKLLADKSLMGLKSNDFKVMIFRPPLVYGEGNAPGNMIRLIHLIAKGIPLPFKRQENKRDFIHIENLIGFINAGINNNHSGIFLVSDNDPIGISQLYRIIVNELHIADRSFKLPGFALKIMETIIPGIFAKLFGSLTIDVSGTIEKLSFHPKPSIHKGIREMVAGVRNGKTKGT